MRATIGWTKGLEGCTEKFVNCHALAYANSQPQKCYSALRERQRLSDTQFIIFIFAQICCALHAEEKLLPIVPCAARAYGPIEQV
jgi:hypothetical protein